MGAKSLTTKPLTARQKAFGWAYVELNNGTQAAIKAGYSKKSADEMSRRLLQHPGVRAHITRLRNAEVERAKERLNGVYDQIGHCINRVGSDFVDEAGDFVDIHELPDRANAAIDGIEIEERTDKDGSKTKKTKLKLVSKASAMDMAVKVLGGYAKAGDTVQVNIDNRRVVLMVPDNHRGKITEPPKAEVIDVESEVIE